MKNEFPISNLRAKYADKTADGKDISEAIAEAQLAGNIPELTNATAEDIFTNKPKFIKYDGVYYVLNEIDEFEIYYSSIYGNVSMGLSLLNDGQSVTIIPESDKVLATETYVEQNKGTKLYKHSIMLSSMIGEPFDLVNNSPTKFTISFRGVYGIPDLISGQPSLMSCIVQNPLKWKIVAVGNGLYTLAKYDSSTDQREIRRHH